MRQSGRRDPLVAVVAWAITGAEWNPQPWAHLGTLENIRRLLEG
jgi:hypothetical protein